MIAVNIFIAFFVTVALGISWLVFNLVFGNKPQMATPGDGETHAAVPEIAASEVIANVSDQQEATRLEATATVEAPVKSTKPRAKTTTRKKTVKAGTSKTKPATKKKTAKPATTKKAAVKKKTAKPAGAIKTTKPAAAKKTATRKPGRPKKQTGITCRDELVAAAKVLARDNGTDEFAAKEIVDYLLENGSAYTTGTIRSQLVFRSGSEEESNNGDGPKDFTRVKRGVYRLAG